jgi:hypothetical protein
MNRFGNALLINKALHSASSSGNEADGKAVVPEVLEIARGATHKEPLWKT